MDTRAFVFQATYRVQAERPVVMLHGRLESGATFLVRDRRQRPSFWIRAADRERAAALGARAAPDERRTFDGAEAARVEVGVPQDAPPLRDRLHTAGVDTFEADVRFAQRYLIDRGVRGTCRIEGEATRGERIDWVFDDPIVTPAPATVTPRVLSFDIETDGRAEQLLAIALYGCGADEVLVVDPRARPMPPCAKGFADERAALDAFCARIAALDPDILTGWNVVDFDLAVLARIAARLRHPLALGREPGALRVQPARGYFGSAQASIPGRVVLDGIDLLRGAFMRFDDYSLDAVARAELGEGKALAGHASDRIEEIQRNYRDDLAAFARYARTDARLALAIVEKRRLIELAMARSRLTGMTPDRVAASIASFDFLYLEALGRRGIVAPTVRSDDARVSVAQAGGHVLEPAPGLHENVWVFDFKSLYPSLIRTFNIDPLAYVAHPTAGADLVATVSGACFRRERAILPTLLDALFPQREAAKRAGDGVASQAIKILMNSFYGVLGTPACRFHNPALANAITASGRHFLTWSKAWFEARGHRVLYGDTDSLFVESGERDVAVALARGRALAAELTAVVGDEIAQRFRVTSRLELEFEKLYVKFFLPSMRHGAGGARKRYAGWVAGAEAVEFVGMEVVRRDWTELAKDVQRELYRRLFASEGVDAYLADVVARLRAGALDERLVYRKALRKDLDAYTAATPPHVQAARKAGENAGRLIAYVMTTAGPEPADARRHPLDREHYVDKQVRPVAEPVLSALGLDFERVIGDERQIGLF
jgi:DNA polymerase-2